MRLPSGYGSVYKLSGNRRKPYIARKTTGWDDQGNQLRQTIGYFTTKKEALEALANFNVNPYSIETSTITFSQVFEKWSVQKFENISRSNINAYKNSFNTSKPLHDMRFVDIRAAHMQEIVRTSGKGHGMLRKLKVLFGQLFKFAMENDIVQKDYSQFVDIGKKDSESKRSTFTNEEIKRLFDVVDYIDFVDSILIMIYSGFRIGELLILEKDNINLEKKLITGGIKTEAGKNRIVPINDKIFNLVKNRYNNTNRYLFANPTGEMVTYHNYLNEKFKPIMKQLGFSHNPHDCRHTFATLMSNAGADTIALQKIIGHANYSTTANVYTHKDIEQLTNAVNLI